MRAILVGVMVGLMLWGCSSPGPERPADYGHDTTQHDDGEQDVGVGTEDTP